MQAMKFEAMALLPLNKKIDRFHLQYRQHVFSSLFARQLGFENVMSSCRFCLYYGKRWPFVVASNSNLGIWLRIWWEGWAKLYDLTSTILLYLQHGNYIQFLWFSSHITRVWYIAGYSMIWNRTNCGVFQAYGFLPSRSLWSVSKDNED